MAEDVALNVARWSAPRGVLPGVYLASTAVLHSRRPQFLVELLLGCIRLSHRQAHGVRLLVEIKEHRITEKA